MPVCGEPDAVKRLAVHGRPVAERIEVGRPPGDPVLILVPQLLPHLGAAGTVVIESRPGEAEVCYGCRCPEDVICPGSAATQPVQGMFLADIIYSGRQLQGEVDIKRLLADGRVVHALAHVDPESHVAERGRAGVDDALWHGGAQDARCPLQMPFVTKAVAGRC